MADLEADQTQEFIDPTDVPVIYLNGVQIGLTNADAGLVALLDNKPVANLKMSFTMVKSLHLLLGELVQRLESATKHDIMTTDTVAKALQESFGQKK